MNTTWEQLAEHLREEVQAYGALLRLFEEQQECVFQRKTERLLELAEVIEDATRTAQETRLQREQYTGTFATERGQSTSLTLRALLPCIEAEARPLLEALIGEVNRLIRRVRRLARQNHLLLSRVVELQQSLLRQFYPGVFTQTYSSHGHAAVTSSAPVPAYQATG